KDKSVSGSPGRGRPSRRKASPEAFPPPSERAQEKASADSSAGSGHSPEPSPISSRFSARTAPRELENEAKREKWGLPKLTEPDKTGSYIIELNVLHAGGLAGSANEFLELYKKNVENPEGRPAVRISKSYYRCQLKDAEWKAIVHADESRDSSERAIYRL